MMNGKACKTPPRGHMARLQGFCRDDSGAMTPFTTMMFFLMLLIGGLAIDVMRHERTRVMLQQTLDNSVLAAAARSQTLDPEDVVSDYFDKAGLSEYLTAITVDQGLNYRSVSADAEADTRPFFMSLMGVDEFYVSADSAAEEKISNIEVSLVLDISGSMDGSRINALRPAARSFVDTIFSNSEAGKVSMSLVPYSTQVNIGPTTFSAFTATPTPQTNSYCMEFPLTTYASLTLPTTSTNLRQNAHFDGFTYSTSNYAAQKTVANWNCNTPTQNYMLPLGYDAATVKSRITNLVVGGNTSTEIGIKWGAHLLDTSAQTLVTSLIAKSSVNASFAGRPLAYDNETLKVLVVMSDGENTYDAKLNPPYNSTTKSPYYRTTGGSLSYYKDRASTTYDYCRYSSDLSSCSWNTSAHSGATQQTWQAMFQIYTAQFMAYLTNKAEGTSASTLYSTYATLNPAGDKNTQMQQICAKARAAGIVIYTIGFEVNSAGKTQLQSCATDLSHYSDATTLNISTVFQSIATQIAYLRLTL